MMSQTLTFDDPLEGPSALSDVHKVDSSDPSLPMLPARLDKNLSLAFFSGVVLLALLVAAARMLSAFGSRQSEESAIAGLLDKIPRSSLIEDNAASEGLAIAYCVIMGSINALSEMFSILEYFGVIKNADAALSLKPDALPVEILDDASITLPVPIAPRRCCTTTCCTCVIVPRAAINALITGGMAFNGALFVFGGQKPSLGSYIAAIFPAVLVFGSSTFFNARKQFKAMSTGSNSVSLEGYKKIIFPLMIASALITNGSTAIYQSLLLLRAFNVEMQVAFPLSLALAFVSNWNLCHAQIPEVKSFLAGAQKSKKAWPHPCLASKLIANSIIFTAAGLTPFNTPQTLEDAAQVLTACFTKMSHLPSSTWYKGSISTPIIWAVGIVFGINVAYSLLAFRGDDVKNLIARGNTNLRDLISRSSCSSAVAHDPEAMPFASSRALSYGALSINDPAV